MLSRSALYKNFVNDFATKLKREVKKNQYDKVIFFCVGTDKVVGDAFGPIVGYRLKQLFENISEVEVYGNLEENLSATNIAKTINYIRLKYTSPLIIAIDSAVSKRENIGKIVIQNGGMQFGKALNKNVGFVGDISIKGIVSQNVNIPRYNFRLLQNTPLNLVMTLADVVSTGIYNVINV